MAKITEEDLAKHIVEYLQNDGWDVYQEVLVSSGRVADIIALRGGVVRVIECKTSLSTNLMEQAYQWLRYAHKVDIAVPKTKTYWRQFNTNRGFHFAIDILKRLGIGNLIYNTKNSTIKEDSAHYFNRKAQCNQIKDALREEHKDYAKAGSAGSQYWTPFKGTRDRLVKFVKENPGKTLSEALENIDYHYKSEASAKRSLTTLIQDGVIDEVELIKNGRKWYLFPRTATGKSQENT